VDADHVLCGGNLQQPLWLPVDEGVLWRATRSPEERAARSVAGAAMTPVAATAAVTMEVKETILNVWTRSKCR
jgi:hypothetical protein